MYKRDLSKPGLSDAARLFAGAKKNISQTA